jgi:hypothetical protein
MGRCQVIGHVLWGWCTIHVLIWFSLAVLLAAVALFALHVRWERKTQPPKTALSLRPTPWPDTRPGPGRHRKPGSTR